MPNLVPSAHTLGRALRDARRTRKLSQAELALRTGVAQPTISSVERGVSNVSLQTLLRLLAALELELLVQERGSPSAARRGAR